MKKLIAVMFIAVLMFNGAQIANASGGPHGRNHVHHQTLCVSQDNLQVFDNAAQYHRFHWTGWQRQGKVAIRLANRLGQRHVAHLFEDSLLYKGDRGVSLAFAARRLAFKHRCK
jgi:hypothetical protein